MSSGLNRHLTAFVPFLIAVLLLPVVTLQAALPVTAEQLRQGERMYREGVLPSGLPLQSVVKGDIAVPGTSFTCVSCHLRSGLGSYEGGVSTLPTNGKSLFQPLTQQYKQVNIDQKYFPAIQQRPKYTDETLAAALRGGVTPSGQVMNPVMPRYLMADGDMDILIAYLKTLSVEPSPGITDSSIAFASVITDDVTPEQYEAMLLPLERYVQSKNNMIKMFKKEKRSERMAAVMLPSSEVMYKTITLSRWFLKGSPDTWRAQLEEYNRKQPVFALLGGISNGSWKPIHDFSEENRIPCLFPQTNFPVVSGTDWYTHYFSKGYYQEGEAAARYLNGQVDVIKPGNVLQLVRITPEGEALSAGFKDTWQDLGHVNLQTETIKDGENLTVEYIQELLARKKPSALILWDGPTAPGILEKITSAPDRPQVVIVSSRYLSDRLTSIPEQARELTYITYPFRLPQDEVRYNFTIESYRKSPKQTEATDPASKQSYILTQLLTQVLMELRGNYYRDNFFDVIGMMKDQDMPLFERLSFGPGQRYASKGCHIVQLGKGQQPNLIKKSDWITF